MQSRGLDFLKPIRELIYEDLVLSENDIEVTYKRYINTKKPPQNPKPDDKTIEEAAKAGLTPGKKFYILKNLKIYFSRKCNLQRRRTHHGT